MYAKTEQKVMFICSYFNIDLLNPNKQAVIKDFTETIYAMSLYPTITQASRITSHSARIIDNILTNNMENKIVRLLVKDITDHLPVSASHIRL